MHIYDYQQKGVSNTYNLPTFEKWWINLVSVAAKNITSDDGDLRDINLPTVIESKMNADRSLVKEIRK